MQLARTLTVFTLCFLLISSTQAQVSVNTGGSSDGSSLVSASGPKGIRKPVRTRSRGGSIRTATARSVFTAKRIVHGNKVVSKGTEGDADFTHVDANSVFAGTATFRSDDGNPVDDFTIDLGLKGILKCKTPDPDIPEFFSLAQMSTDVIVDGDSKFSGGATQDGEGSFTSFGDIAISDFTTAANRARIKKKFLINLGTLTDGQKLAFFFAGSTLVSYGADVPISFCAADFFKTDTFKASKKQAGKLKIEAGKTVTVGFIDDVTVTGDEVLFIESSDETLLDTSNLHVVIALGGGTFAATTGTIGDVDNDNIADVVITADNSLQATLIAALQSSFNNSVFVFGQSTNGDAFSGLLSL